MSSDGPDEPDPNGEENKSSSEDRSPTLEDLDLVLGILQKVVYIVGAIIAGILWILAKLGGPVLSLAISGLKDALGIDQKGYEVGSDPSEPDEEYDKDETKE